MYELEDKDEEEAFYDYLGSDRAVGIVLAAIVENRLTSAIKASMRKDETVWGDLFRPGAPVGDFGTKIRLAYMLHLYPRDLYRDLIIVSKIRNAFAHRVTVKEFTDQPVCDLVRSLKAVEVWKSVRDDTKAHTDSRGKLMHQVLDGDLETLRESYRLCIRYYIWKLVMIEKSILEAEDSDAPKQS